MPDQFEALFAGLRAETLPRVRPPGPVAARGTVRRRRTTRTVVAASAVLAVAGTVAAVGLPRHQETPAERHDRLTAAARRAAGEQGTAPNGRILVGPVTPGSTERFPDLSAGSYTLAVACAGSGTLTVSVTLSAAAGSTDLGGQVASCALEPRAARMEIRLPVDGELTVGLRGDPAAAEAVYSVMVAPDEAADRAVPVDPQSVWNADRAAQLLVASGLSRPERMTTERPGGSTTQRVERTASYELRMVCAGLGNVTVTVRPAVAENPLRPRAGTLLSETVACTDVDPQVVYAGSALELTEDTEVQVSITADEQASNRAGFAYALDPA
ncbi:hypothetical protein [Couchioplanes azureus]|uniref:hypothetical protein n=1 Tax=Couchioplanes caeruleus TaxID=56438 RepID=UPI001670DB95|nr:hypothetical protein [Couchioplanes caeruleus]GGQ67336.1 hypothetical protein GCM10010166_41560 [Couchioplanes caeruleus subsp. azureus]